MKKYSTITFKIHRKRRIVRNGLLFGLLIIGMGLSTILSTRSADAFPNGGGGGGGGAGGCDKSKPTWYCQGWGNGWAIYQTNSGGPTGGFQNGLAWSKVQSTCKGISQVAVYVIANHEATPKWKSYDFLSRYDGTPTWYSTGDFISTDTARTKFNSLPPNLQKDAVDGHKMTFGSDVAWFCYGSAENWTIDGQSYIMINGGARQQNTISAYPGEELNWDHDLRNKATSTTDMTTTVDVEIPRYGGFTAYPEGTQKEYGKKGTINELFFTAYTRDGYGYSRYTVQVGDIGKKLCQRIDWTPGSSSDKNKFSSTEACAQVHSNYSLYPQVKIGGGTNGVVVVGGAADQQSSVENIAARSDVNSNYQSYDFVVPAGKTIDLSTVFKDQGNGRIFALVPGGTDICKDWLSAKYPGAVTCKNPIANGSTMFNGGMNSVDQSAISAAGYKAGDLVCRLLWVDHYDYSHTTPDKNSDERRVSLPACVRVAKTPYIQFWGGDVRVGDSIGGATSTQANAYTNSNLISGKTLGSWAEYGIFAPTNGIIQSASAGALSGKNGFAGTATDTDVSHLTFANTSTPKGNWSAPANIASFENSLGLPDGGSTSDASISVDAFRGKVTLTNNSGTVHVGGTLSGGSLMLLYPTGTVVIDSNIILGKNSYSSLADLSQIVIQAKNIIINNNVDRVDAWLVAIATDGGTVGGVVSTCDTIVTPYYSGLTAKADSPCNQKPLRINGPVMGREVQLRRTFGAEGDNTPAETIDLRADAYLWTLQAANNGSIDTVFTTELPPRF